MKKHLFISVLSIMTLATSLTSTFGQTAVKNSAPRPLTCTESPLNPIAGKPYDYSATFNPDGGKVFWYATKSTTFMTGSTRSATIETAGAAGSTVASATDYASELTASGPSKTNITWSSDGLAALGANPLFVAVEYTAPASGCANNMKVYKITPKNAFTIDIRSMTSDGSSSAAYDVKTDQCAALVKSATYDGTKMVMDYGVQTLYYEVVAANFTGSFTPSYQISGLQPGQTAEIFWGYTTAGATNTLGAITNNTPVTGAVASTALTETKDGASIFVKVVIQNATFENTAGETIKLAVDAVNSAGQKDVLESDCSENLAFADFTEQDIKARPAISPVAPATFIPEN